MLKVKFLNAILFSELSLCGYPVDLIDKGFIEQNNLALKSSFSNIRTFWVVLDLIIKFLILRICLRINCKNIMIKYYCQTMMLMKKGFYQWINQNSINSNKWTNKKIGVQICEDLWDKNYSCKFRATKEGLN